MDDYFLERFLNALISHRSSEGQIFAMDSDYCKKIIYCV
jgi:hypothetical protein